MRHGSAARLFGLATVWGSNFLWIRLALDGFSPVQITLLRIALGAVTLLAVIRASGQRLPRDRGIWGHFLVAALVANALPYWLFAYGEQLVPSSLAGALNATTPLFTVVTAVALRAEVRPSPVQLVGLVVGFVGAVVVVSPWTSGNASLLGASACLLASASYGLSYAYMGRWLAPRQLPPLVLAGGQLIAASALLAVVTPFAGRQPIGGGMLPTASLLVLGFVGTGFAYVLNYRLITDDGPSAASTVTYLLPAVSIGLGVALLSEPATWHLLAGTAIVLAGVALVHRRPGDRPSTGPA